jgi:protein TonB
MNNASIAPERNRNLTYSAVFTVAMMAGVAVWGERTHFVRIFAPMEKPPTIVTISIPPDPPEVIDEADARPKSLIDLQPPALPDSPVKPEPTQFTIPIEPPHVDTDVRMMTIPQTRGDGGLGARAWNLSQLDQSPVPTFQAKPVYPEAMKRTGLTGEVLVDFIVDPEGKVRNERAVRSSQHEFEEPACSAVARWKFRPGRKDGRAVYVHMQVPIVFTLDQD